MTLVTYSHTRYRVGGMDCASCAAKIDTALRRLPGVEDVAVSVTSRLLAVTHAPEADLRALERRVVGLGYTIGPFEAEPLDGRSIDGDEAQDRGDHDRADATRDPASGPSRLRDSMIGRWAGMPKARLTIASGLALAIAFATGSIVPAWSGWAFAAAMTVGLVPIARRAIAAALAGTPFSIETLMTVAAIGALVIGAGEEAATVVFLFLAGELLEGVAAGRGRAGIESLTTLLPKTALVERDGGGTAEIAADRLSLGAILLVRPGDRIAADGEIIAGEGAVDEAPVTGESIPVHKRPGDGVFAGTVNTEGVLRVRVTATADDNTIARVVRQVEEAQESKAPTERFVDRFARRYTPGVVAVAAVVMLAPPLLVGAPWHEWIYKGLALLLIGCPCALVISTPAAIASALSSGARRGLLMKGGAVLERLGSVTVAALDKTGTLTTGKPVVTDIVSFSRPETQVLSLAASLEEGSSHPLAAAVLARAAADGVPIPPFAAARAIPGRGVAGRIGGEEIFFGSVGAVTERLSPTTDQHALVERLVAEGKTVSLLTAGDAIVGSIAMRDEPRPDARSGLAALRALGVTPMMLTGDDRRTAAAIADDLGLEVRAELLPADKLAIVRDLQARGEVVAKIGDGINDAPALAAADVGIAMGGGTDVALETADAAVLHGRVGDVARLIALSRRTMAVIRQNITIALGLKAVFLVTTVAGLTGLWPAILADTGATVLVTINALRLLR